MKYPDDGEHFSRYWYLRPFVKQVSATHRWQGQPDSDIRILLRNVIETRRLLADVVYRVPETMLDDVLRFRLGHLTGSDEN